VALNHATIQVIDNQPRGSQFVLAFPLTQPDSDKLSE